MKDQALISICIPTYNNELFIADTLRAILNQSYKNIEVIILDDTSTDNTVQIIKSIVDPRITLIQNEKNLGMNGNWNKVLSLAKGDYMKLVCGDDLIFENCLELQLNEFQKPENADLAMVGAKRKVINSNGKSSFGSFYKLRPGKYSAHEVMKYCVLFGTNLVGEPMTVLFKSSAYRDSALNLESSNYMIDMDMYAKLLSQGNFYMLPNELGAFRIHAGSVTGSLGLKQAHYYNNFMQRPEFRQTFKIKTWQLLIGKQVTFVLNLARNLVLSLNK